MTRVAANFSEKEQLTCSQQSNTLTHKAKQIDLIGSQMLVVASVGGGCGEVIDFHFHCLFAVWSFGRLFGGSVVIVSEARKQTSHC